jgi:leucyl aminopeptidase
VEIQISAGPTETFDLWFLGVGRDLDADLAPIAADIPGLAAWAALQGFKGGRGEALILPSPAGRHAPTLVLLGLEDRSAAAVQQAAGKAGSLSRAQKAKNIRLDLGIDGKHAAHAIEFLSIGNYSYDAYRPDDSRKPAIERAVFVGLDATAETLRGASIRARWQQFCRELVDAPPADLYPDRMIEHARAVADEVPGISLDIWNAARCKDEGLVGIIAVGQGSSRPPCLIHLRYAPAGATRHVALVGKGVTFDSGGLSLKPSASMQTMRCDMAGSATVLATIAAAAQTNAPVIIDAYLACVENMNDGNSYKLGDILKYRNGVTVEIHNTDAEGRLVLADALLLASESGATHVVDLATLTGAIVVALGKDFTGLFSNDDDLANALSAAGQAEGEGLWRMPLHAPYRKLLKGEWGQIKNVGGPDAGSATAALFLQYFVKKDLKWAHLDIAGSAFYDRAGAPYGIGATGQMVRSLTTWLHGA